MANKWTTALRKIEGALVDRYDPYAHIIRTPSPSTNVTFGRTHGLPLGYSVLLWGPPGSGKTLLSNATIGQLHQDDPEAIVVKYDTEMRDDGQMTEDDARMWGIDLDRYIVYQVNGPDKVFNNFKSKVGALVAKGAPVKLAIIDSISGVQGRQQMNSKKGVLQMGMGDHAHTIQIGLKEILGLQREHRISLICTAHVRAETNLLQQRRGHALRANASFGCQHHCEYFMFVARNENKEGRSDIQGRAFIDPTRVDLSGQKVDTAADVTGHRIKVWMQKSSFGKGVNREGEFTLDYSQGIINTQEEIYRLAEGWGILQQNGAQYILGDQKFKGMEQVLKGIEEKPELRKFVLDELLRMDAERKVRDPNAIAAASDDVDDAYDDDEDEEIDE